MRFDLKKPCADCPFIRTVHPFLSRNRARAIAEYVASENRTFTCHKHLNGEHRDSGDDDIRTIYDASITDQHCAGAMAFVDKLETPNAMLQVAERLGLRKRDRLDPASLDLVFDSVDEMATHHGCG